MLIYVAAPLEAADLVREANALIHEAGHELALDWTRDMSFVAKFSSQPERSAAMAAGMIDAVLRADAVAVLATHHEGRGMFVELGAALARATQGSLAHLATIGDITARESVFHQHPSVEHFPTMTDWLGSL
ncbi:hypothetical protein [Calidifontibacter indicus]|uniref:Nucleoside 2-deoxyribosyltransferase-like protein n=1 Tax=Calidifontibacter indicus TaxID=419650 RepID=A0A3D9UNS4_9MICO|nr:hypothetical protein [Calidifontibacter indicus]REF30987.1 hypothetical protein DFJ65_2025 [Calidifontibacter indicus]